MDPSPLPDPHIRLKDVHLAFGERLVFGGLSCDFERGSICVLLGGSGSGKSTLLRLVGGLLAPDGGSIVVAGQEVVASSTRELREVRNRLGMMFQGGALLDSLSVYQNLALPLRERLRMREPEIGERVRLQLAAVGLEGTEGLLPRQLSGGMIKRAALARALISEPEILLCDEPFSGLDPTTVHRIEALLLEVRRSLGMTLLVTSHHIPSSLRMADQLLMLMDGVGIAGPPSELLVHADPRVREFLDEETAPGGRRAAASGSRS